MFRYTEWSLEEAGKSFRRPRVQETRDDFFSVSSFLPSLFCFFLFTPRGQGRELSDCYMKVVRWWVWKGRREARFYSVCTHLQSTRTFAWALVGSIERAEAGQPEYLVQNYNYSHVKVLLPIDLEQGWANFLSQWFKEGLQKFRLTRKCQHNILNYI